MWLWLRAAILAQIPAETLERLMHFIPASLAERLGGIAIRGKSGQILRDAVDWSRTSAFAHPGFAGIFVTSQNDYEKTRDRICGELRGIRRAGPFEIDFSVWKREEVYHGKNVRFAPDIVFEAKARRGQSEDYGECYLSAEIGDGLIWGKPPCPGGHRTEGLWMIKGPGIKKVKLSAQIIDLVPTILHILGIPIPADLDGRPLSEIFQEEDQRKQPSRRQLETLQAARNNGRRPMLLSPADEEEIRDRLKKLGYLG
jgi:predicted AlkP superfamily phosphohydrolase/phosphomutase